jgi:hypothetical protein
MQFGVGVGGVHYASLGASLGNHFERGEQLKALPGQREYHSFFAVILSPAARPEIMAKLWLKRHQNASQSLTVRAEKDTANRLLNQKFVGFYGKN